jgi:hypothetical protein
MLTAKYSFSQRKKMAKRILSQEKLPICVYCVVDERQPPVARIIGTPRDATVSQLLNSSRVYFSMSATTALFCFADGIMLNGSHMLSVIYGLHRDDDKFLYVKVYKENTFGLDVNEVSVTTATRATALAPLAAATPGRTPGRTAATNAARAALGGATLGRAALGRGAAL